MLICKHLFSLNNIRYFFIKHIHANGSMESFVKYKICSSAFHLFFIIYPLTLQLLYGLSCRIKGASFPLIRSEEPSVKEITKLGKTSLSDFTLCRAELLHTEERKSSVLPDLHRFIDCLCRLRRHVWKCERNGHSTWFCNMEGVFL